MWNLIILLGIISNLASSVSLIDSDIARPAFVDPIRPDLVEIGRPVVLANPLPETERIYINDPKERITWLSRVLGSLMDAEDEVRASRVMALIEAWSSHLSQYAPETLVLLRRIKDQYLKFSVNQKQILEVRRAQAPIVLGLAVDQQETPPERLFADSILADLLRKDLKAGYAQLEASQLRPRLYKMDMVLLSATLALQNKQPCVALWDEAWALHPLQKFAILKTYWNLLFTNYYLNYPEEQFFLHPVFRPVLGLPHARGIMERLSLAVGNNFTTARLSSYAGIREQVQHCQLLNNTRRLQMAPFVKDYQYAASHELVTATVPPIVQTTLNSPVYSFDMVPSPSAVLEGDYRLAGPNYLAPRRINPLGWNFNSPVFTPSVAPFPGD